jgi:N-acetylated-alpha-linked acidic dipeptidase
LTASSRPAHLLPLTAFLLFLGHALRLPAQEPARQPAAPAAQSDGAPATPASPGTPASVFGFRDFTRQSLLDAEFLAVPDPKLAQQHLQTLTASPHWASSPEDYATALYVEGRFKAAGLQTEIVPYRVLLNKPSSILIEAFDDTGKKILSNPTREHVDLPAGSAAARFQDDPRILPGFSSSSPSGDVTAPVVYANYGRLSDFQRLASLGVSVKGRIVIVRYGENFRGVKVYIAQQYGAIGVLIYSDPEDDGSKAGQTYPDGPWRPDSAVQRGSVQFIPIYPGDPTTPGVASTPTLPESARIPLDKLQYDLPSIPVNPLSSADAAPILRALGGPGVPRDWQGGLNFPYRLGGDTSVTVHMRLLQDAQLRTIWDVIGKVPGASDSSQWVIMGNHRDAWVYGAADPNSGTAAMLEAVHGLGVLLHQGWKPRRTIVVASWDAEEEGLIGSTEWVEQNLAAPHSTDPIHAVAYLNTDVAVSGPDFKAAAVPSLRGFLREIASEVPSPAGGTVFQQWKKEETRKPASAPSGDPDDDSHLDPGPHIGELGSGSDYTPFLQHEGVPSTDIGSDGPYGVYHTVYDNYDWFARFADPSFAYLQQQARILGLEVLHMADADVLPFDDQLYADQIRSYLDQAQTRARTLNLTLDFSAALAAADRFAAAAHSIHQRQLAPPRDAAALDRALSSAERALLIPEGLPRRPWYRHSIYAPGEFTGYSAVAIPGVNEAIDALDPARAQTQLAALAQALSRAATAITLPNP